MSVVIGPLNKSQQRADHKWSVPLNEGYVLYIGAPACVYSPDASRNALLAALPSGGRVIDSLTTQANALISAETARDKPGRLKVYYKKYTFGDIQFTPQYPEVEDSAGKTRSPNQAENAFTGFCAKMLPMYDVTLRSTERKQLSWLQKMFGVEDAVPLDLKSPPAVIPEEGVKKLFAGWKGFSPRPKKLPSSLTLNDFMQPKNMKMYVDGAYDGSGYVEFTFAGSKIGGTFNKLVVFDVREAKRAAKEILCRKLMFLGPNATPESALASITISPDAPNNMAVELRVAGDMKRVPLPVSTKLFLAPKGSKVKDTSPINSSFLLNPFALVLVPAFVISLPMWAITIVLGNIV